MTYQHKAPAAGTHATYVPYIYMPYLDNDDDDSANSHLVEPPTPEVDADFLNDISLGLYPIPRPLGYATYTRRVEIIQHLRNELAVIYKDLRLALEIEEQRWKEWNQTQKDMMDWEIRLTSTRFVWWKMKMARLRYNVGFNHLGRKDQSLGLHWDSDHRKRREAQQKAAVLRVEAARQLRELQEIDRAEKSKRDGRRWLERALMPSCIMEEIAMGRLAKPEKRKLEARYVYPHSPPSKA
ncbi:hypothetical protein QBC34DRAFT_419350 [Podospora aff. communis PSN243]|uniref:Uncharacterized protein n=1 Tax=Podospora aff. communis PSN243 TaxID=3040156 RepID=A0AAV9FX94_9PEZI|nr:hypothetical protein QBC34DRAFT_419350 [Podospora aff. communis PSN243]